MQATLQRTDYRQDGIFSTFTFDSDTEPFMVTLEHSYESPRGGWIPKILPGLYTCVRGQHELHSGPVESFEVMGVLGHSGLLCCHVGNYNNDSEGCVLAGKTIFQHDSNSPWMVTESKVMYEKFMERLEELDAFMLLVKG